MKAVPCAVERVDGRVTSESTPCLGNGLVMSEAASHELLDTLLEVKADLLVHLVPRPLRGAR
jgi:hypothetical protein